MLQLAVAASRGSGFNVEGMEEEATEKVDYVGISVRWNCKESSFGARISLPESVNRLSITWIKHLSRLSAPPVEKTI